MLHKKIVLGDIQTSDILYYDPNIEKECWDFCDNRDIDCLPALNNPKKFYRKTGDNFSEEDVKPEMMVDNDTYIFDPILLERFKENPLLFVYQGNELTGVVHFSDYNRPEVDQYLFGLLSAYEKSLRDLLVSKGFTNEHMVEYLKSKNQLKKYERIHNKNPLIPKFQACFLYQLLGFIAEHKKELNLDLCQSTDDLRNKVMHMHESVNKKNPNQDNYIYDIETFKPFFDRVITFLQDYKKVNNRVAFSKDPESNQ
jgi:hypothetical protein